MSYVAIEYRSQRLCDKMVMFGANFRPWSEVSGLGLNSPNKPRAWVDYNKRLLTINYNPVYAEESEKCYLTYLARWMAVQIGKRRLKVGYRTFDHPVPFVIVEDRVLPVLVVKSMEETRAWSPEDQGWAVNALGLPISTKSLMGFERAAREEVLRLDDLWRSGIEPTDTDIDAFVKSVSKRAKTIDPDEERDWYDLAYGFFLGRGVSPKKARELARQVNS